MSAKHVQHHRDLIWSLADRVHHLAEERKAQGSPPSESDSMLLGRDRLAGWKPLEERRAAKRAASDVL